MSGADTLARRIVDAHEDLLALHDDEWCSGFREACTILADVIHVMVGGSLVPNGGRLVSEGLTQISEPSQGPFSDSGEGPVQTNQRGDTP